MLALEQYSILIEGRGYSGAKKERYEARVAGMVNGIGQTRAGKILLHYIKNSGTQRDWVFIRPFENTSEAKKDRCNAYAFDDLWVIDVGRRQIMAVPVWFSPETFMNMSPCTWGQPVSNPLHVLVHELVHAQRFVSRISNNNKLTGALAGYEYEEEFYAIVFANVWASTHTVGAATRDGLRADHGTGRLPSPEEDSEVWMTNRDNYRMVEKYCHSQSKLTREMAEIPVKFNPFRTYYAWKTRRAS